MLKWWMILFATSCLISQSAMDLFSTLAILTLVWQKSKRPGFSFYKLNTYCHRNGVDWIFPIWVGVVAIGFLLNATNGTPWLARIIEFKWIIVFYLITESIITLQPSKKIIKPAGIIFSLACIYAIIIYLIGHDPIGENIYLSDSSLFKRVGGFFSNPMTFAHLYGVVFCWFFGYFLVSWLNKGEYRYLITLTVIVSGISLLLSFTRGVWLGLFIAAIVMFFLVHRIGAIIFLFLGMVSVKALYEFWPSFQLRMNYHLQNKTYDDDRMNLWLTNIEIWKDYPIFGIGYGENARRLPEYFQKLGILDTTLISHAHNQYLHFLSGTGALGLTCYLVISLYFLVKAFQTLKKAREQGNLFHIGLLVGVIGGQIEFLLSGLTEANFEHSKVRYVVMLGWSFVAWLGHEYGVISQNPADRKNLREE